MVGVVVAVSVWIVLRVTGDVKAGSLSYVAVSAAGSWIVGLLVYPGAVAAAFYWESGRPANSVHFLSRQGARASALVRPDPSGDAEAGDVLASFLAARPVRGSHVGTDLGDWIRDSVHAAGGRVIAFSRRALLPAYLKRGMVIDGPTRLGMTKVASRAGRDAPPKD